MLVAAFGTQIARRGDTYEAIRPEERRRDLVFASVATTYTIFMILAGGLKFLLLSAVLYAPGTMLYVWARREQNKRVFAAVEWLIFAAVVVCFVIGVYGLAMGLHHDLTGVPTS